jgi:hypothetical protein
VIPVLIRQIEMYLICVIAMRGFMIMNLRFVKVLIFISFLNQDLLNYYKLNLYNHFLKKNVTQIVLLAKIIIVV